MFPSFPPNLYSFPFITNARACEYYTNRQANDYHLAQLPWHFRKTKAHRQIRTRQQTMTLQSILAQKRLFNFCYCFYRTLTFNSISSFRRKKCCRPLQFPDIIHLNLKHSALVCRCQLGIVMFLLLFPCLGRLSSNITKDPIVHFVSLFPTTRSNALCVGCGILLIILLILIRIHLLLF